ncbi:MAG: beta-ketoacyl synthase [Bacteroidales bacterium]|nr:beta-ketoacyl synthase [Bacteroidales bacterium]HOY39795.1 beta-ketoacyl synthase N-terminal-like domain-containing protein [Bacteroidales bacterium]HQP04677.1 beta-ketoacyl synthase N-terminal-like domain-containing protein [Bacteroidales bacterium]
MAVVYQISDNIISPLGLTTHENYVAVVNGQHGLRKFSNDYLEVSEDFCAAIIDDCNTYTMRQKFGLLDKYTRAEKLSILSVALAMENSGIDASSERTLFVVSTTKGNISVLEGNFNREHPDKRLYLWHLAQEISDYFNNPNTPVVVSQACISGISAQIVAKRLILSGRFDHAIVVGIDLVTRFVVSGFQSFKALSPDPCRPFDAERKGLNIGEAAATIIYGKANSITELPENAIYLDAESVTNDANHISGPSRTGEGLFQAIQKAMLQSGNTLPDFICAHGTATPYNDEMEAIALTRAGLLSVPVFSLKPYFGHTLGAAGVLETILASEALKNNMVLRNMNYTSSGVSAPVNVVTSNSKLRANSFLKTISGFGGCNAAAIFKKKGGAL